MSGTSHYVGADGVVKIDYRPNACTLVLAIGSSSSGGDGGGAQIVIAVVIVGDDGGEMIIVIGGIPDVVFKPSEGGATIAAMSQAPV